MREIKFRAWDIDGKCWIPQRSFAVFADQSQQNFGNILSYEDDEGYLADGIEINIEQFTGLNDKNGKEIYEGDVIEREIYHGSIDQAVVVYVQELCAFMWQTLKNYPLGFDGGNADFFNSKSIKSNIGWHVIGNIHQDSHLLK